MSSVLACRQLEKTFGEGEVALTILHDIDFTVNAGERIAIMGTSGSGKSTCCICWAVWMSQRAGISR